VTGGAGFIGSNIVERLVGQGERVRVLDNFSTGKRENPTPWLDRIELIKGDVRDPETARRAMVERAFYFRRMEKTFADVV
jgi:UDP-glucose 4-epimerase